MRIQSTRSTNHTSYFVLRPSNNHCTIQDSLGRVTEAGASQISALSPRLSALAIGILLLLTPIAYAELENFQAADVVLGQPDFSQATANNGGVSARSLLAGVLGVFTDGKKLFVADTSNHRILIWNTISTSNFAPADVVLGQPGFTTNATNNDGGVTSRSLNTPRSVFFDGKRLFVGDPVNHRVLIWNKIPTTNFTPADVVLGQPNFTSSTANNGGVSARSLNSPNAVFSDDKKLFVADQENWRVLIWNTIPTTNFAPADVVLGKSNFNQSTAEGGTSERLFRNTRGVFSDGKRLFVADTNNARVLIWNSIPTSNFAPADVVLGQPDFTKNTNNNGGVSARSLIAPTHIFSDGKRLFVADPNNNRVLVWNDIPTINFTPADVVLGQPDFSSNAANNGGVSARSINVPRGIVSDGKRLFVTDSSNNRLLIYNLSSSSPKPDPQFEQGKAVVGKVFLDWNENGIQDSEQGRGQRAERRENKSQPSALTSQPLVEERGLEGIKVVSDTGIYAITDQDGKYHFPYIETGQRVLKLDESTLPEGSTLTTDNPYKATITKGILTKVSFGVKLPEDHSPQTIDHSKELSHRLLTMDHGPLLQVSITQDTQKPTKTLGITAELITPKGQSPQNGDSSLIKFTTTCNYYLFIKESMILLYDSNQKPIKTLTLPQPIPLYYEIPIKDLPKSIQNKPFYYQLVVRDAQGRSDRTQPVKLEI